MTLCIPDEIDPVEGWGWVLHWPCGESENTVLDPREAIRIHCCPDVGREAESSSPLRLVRPSGAQIRPGYPPCTEAWVSDDGGGELKDRQGHASPSPAIDTGVRAPGQRARQVAHMERSS